MQKLKPATIKIILACWGFILICLHLAAALTRTSLLWGVDSWAYYSLPWVIGLALAGTILLLPGVNPGLVSAFSFIKYRLYPSDRRYVRRLVLFWIVCLTIVAVWQLSCRIHLLGDGYLLIRTLEQGNIFKRHAPLGLHVTIIAGSLARNLIDLSWQEAFRITSVISGAVFFYFLYKISNRLGDNPASRVLIFFGMGTMALVQMFFGYVEVYPPLNAMLMIYIFLALKLLDGESGVVTLTAVFWLCVLMHLSALSLLPSLLYLHLYWWKNMKIGMRFKAAISAYLLPLVLVAGISALIGLNLTLLLESEGPGPLPFIPFIEKDSGLYSFGLFSFSHLISLFNLLLLVSPFLLPLSLLTLFWAGAKFPLARFLVAASVFPLVTLALFNPAIGFPRDWDLFAYVFIAPTLLGLLALAELMKSSRAGLNYTITVLVGLGMIHTFSWIAVNADESKSVERYERLLESNIGYSINARVSSHEEAGIFFRSRGRHADAIRHYELAAEADPGVARFYLNIATIRLMTGEPSKALAAAEKALSLEPESAKAHYVKGVALAQTGRFTQARVSFDKVIELDPENWEAFNKRGSIRVLLGNHNLAVGDFNRVLELNPDYTEAYYSRGMAYYLVGKYSEAVKDFSLVLSKDPLNANAYSSRGAAFLNLGDYEKAVSDFSRVIEMNPADDALFFNRGLTYWKLGDPERALRDYTQAIGLNSQNAEAYLNRGVIQASAGNDSIAVADFQAAAKLGNDQAQEYLKNRGIEW